MARLPFTVQFLPGWADEGRALVEPNVLDPWDNKTVAAFETRRRA